MRKELLLSFALGMCVKFRVVYIHSKSVGSSTMHHDNVIETVDLIQDEVRLTVSSNNGKLIYE